MPAGLSVETKPVACPRCGYDQRGVISSWHETCPLGGVCAECGLTFDWADVFDPLRTMPRWLVESQRGLARWPWQFVRTSLRAWRAGSLWRALRMSHPHSPSRQTGFVLTWLIAVWLVIATSNGFLAFASASCNVGMRRASGGDPWAFGLLAAVNPWHGDLPYYIRMLLRHWPLLLGVLTIPVTTAVAFIALPVSRRRAKVQWRHVRRAAVYLFGLVGSVIALHIISRALATSEFIWLAMSPAATTLAMTVLILSQIATVLALLCSVALPMVVFWYWLACVRLHLCMSQAWAVAGSVVIIGLLASGAVAFWSNEWLR